VPDVSGMGGLTTDEQTLSQRFRQLGFAHALLHRGDVISNAPELDGLIFEVGDGETGARISIARLADGAGIQQVAALCVQSQRGERFAETRMNLQNFQFGIGVGKSALMMSVAEECNWRVRVQQAFQSLGGREDVFVFVVGCAMNQLETVDRERAAREIGEPLQMFRSERGVAPIHGGFCDGIEVVSGHYAGNGFVVIAANGEGTEFAQLGGHFVGIRPVTDYVAQTDGALPAAFGGFEYGIECRKIGVKIADNQDAQI
jgi:hypothetical protein